MGRTCRPVPPVGSHFPPEPPWSPLLQVHVLVLWSHGLVILRFCSICWEKRHMSNKPGKIELLSVPEKEWERRKFWVLGSCGQGWGQLGG